MKNEMRFEEGLSKLEGIVNRLEGGELSLEESLACFEQGMKLTKLCQEKLESAQAKVEILTKSDQGELLTQPFEPVDE